VNGNFIRKKSLRLNVSWKSPRYSLSTMSIPRSVMRIPTKPDDLPEDRTIHPAGIVGRRVMLLQTARNHFGVGQIVRLYVNGKGSPHHTYGRGYYVKAWRKIRHVGRRMFVICSNTIRSTMKMRMSISRPSMCPIRWLPLDARTGGRRWILSFQSHRSELDIGRKRSEMYAHFSNQPRFQFQSRNLPR
jgi:hypothetical protein